jgi:phosphoglycolate phosphatase-like HAD superfamily hydrolase
MGFINTIVEFEGPVVDVRPRYWAAHQAAVAESPFQGPAEDEFWRLVRTGATDAMILKYAKGQQVTDYTRVRNERIDSTEMMALDELQPAADNDLRVLKSLGTCHLVTLCRNRDGINATLDRLGVWMYFDQKRVLPEDRVRRVAALRELVGGHRSTLAVVGTVPVAYAAGEAGCRVVGLRNGPAVPRMLQQVGVDVFYDTLDELTDAITRRSEELERIGLF